MSQPITPHHKVINVLFTSVGRRVELLRAFRRAYKTLGLQGKIVALDIDPIAPALQVADRPYIVPRLTAAGYLPKLVNICKQEAIDLIFPLIDPDILVLAQQRKMLEATGAKLAVVSAEAAAITSDKWETTQFFQSLDLPTPQSWLPHQIDPEEANYPLFIKPRRGSAAKNTFKVNNARELRFFLGYVPDPIIQECLPGPEITTDVICDLTGKVLGVVSRQRIEARWGEVAKGVTIYHPGIIQACLQIAEALPACGPITVQCLMKDDGFYFTEINARFGGGVPLGIEAGADSPAWLLAKAANLPFAIPPIGSYQTKLYLTRFDDAFLLTEAEREQMASCHL